MVDAEGPVESRVVAMPSGELTEVESVGGAKEAIFEGCPDTTTEVGRVDTRKYESNVLPYEDDNGVFWFECHGFKLKEQFLLFYAAHRANERVIPAVALSVKSSEGL